MKIKYLAHACFLITTQKGIRIITDPYSTGRGLSYGEINETADLVLVTHDHGDHNNAAAVKGNPKVVKAAAGSQEIGGIKIKGIPAFHDEQGGKQRGKDIIYNFMVDGLNLCHVGDLGHILSDSQAKEISPVDLLFIPVGGFYTIDAPTASKICDQLKPKIAIPMHFKTAKCEYPINGVEEFTRGKKEVRQIEGSETEILAGKLPALMEILVLKPAML